MAALAQRIKYELHEVSQIGKPEPRTLLKGRPYHSEVTHATVTDFLARQIRRGLVIRTRHES